MVKMAKKKPTAKQIAARKKFARIMKSGGFKKKSAKKSRSKKTKTGIKKRISKTIRTRKMTRKPMARRRSVRRSMRKSSSKIGGFFKSGMVGKAVAGIGAATLVGVVMNQVAPQFSGIAAPVAGFAAGGPVGGIASIIVSPTGLSGITNLISPAQTSSQGVMSV